MYTTTAIFKRLSSIYLECPDVAIGGISKDKDLDAPFGKLSFHILLES